MLARFVDVYVAVSEDVAARCEPLLELPPGSISVIPNGIPDPGTIADRSQLDGTVIGAVGRLSPEKGFATLVEAMRWVDGRRLVLIGDGPERARLHAMAEELGVADRVTFAGWVDWPWVARWAFDLLVVPSLSESFGLVVAEGMLAQTPIVATRVGGIPELVVEGETGTLVPPNDPRALADAINKLLGDPMLREAMGQRGREVALERLTASSMARAFTDLYSSMFQQHSSTAPRSR
jgi:glycosyltransferase involved in cell wall biosynthesis